MKRRIEINPVTRIEGHAKVLIDLAADGSVEFAGLIVNELRGFERILVGMEAARMPQITARICGVCPSAHHLAAVKAIEQGSDITPPPAARLQRELLYMGHIIHSHAANLFALAGPDLYFDLDDKEARRNIAGLVDADPDLARKALRLRSLGQKINESVGGRGIHPVTAVVGGMASRIDDDRRRELKELSGEALQLAIELSDTVKQLLTRQLERFPALRTRLAMKSAYLGTVRNNKVSFYEGQLRLIDENGLVLKEFDAPEYADLLHEKATRWSYMKPVYCEIDGKERSYRVSTLARLNVASGFDTELAQKELLSYREMFGHPCHLTVMQLYARLIEMLYACENAVRLADAPELSGTAREEAKLIPGRGVGHVEAPRGTLFHDYTIDEKGIVRSANLLVATQQNYAAINQSLKQMVESFIDHEEAQFLNAVEYAVRTYDPCLSCATHALGRMPLQVSFRQDGRIVRELQRGGSYG